MYYRPALSLSFSRQFVGFGIFCLQAVSFPLLSSSDNNFKRGKAGGSRGVDRPKTNYSRVTCTVIYGCLLPLWYPYRSTVLFFYTQNAFVLANPTRAAGVDELD